MLRSTVLLLAVAGSLAAQQPAGGAPPAGGATPPRSTLRPFAEVTRDAVHRPGFFDTYQKDDKVWIAVPRERFGQDFLMETKLSQGIGANGLFGGTMLDIFEGRVMRLERRGEQVFLMQMPHRF